MVLLYNVNITVPSSRTLGRMHVCGMGDSPKVRSPHWEPLLGPVIRTGKWVGRARTVELHGMIAKTSGERARQSTELGHVAKARTTCDADPQRIVAVT